MYYRILSDPTLLRTECGGTARHTGFHPVEDIRRTECGGTQPVTPDSIRGKTFLLRSVYAGRIAFEITGVQYATI